MSFGRGLRLRPDLHHHLNSVDLREYLGSLLTQSQMPASATNSDLLPLIGGVGDQDGIGACAGWTVMRDAFGLAVVGQTGQPIDLSGLGGYTIGRMLENRLDGLPPTTPLQDNGSDPGTNILALQTFGPVLQSEWPSTPDVAAARVNLPIDDLGISQRSAAMVPWTVGVYGGLAGVSGSDAINAVCQALLPFADGKRGRAVTIDVDASTSEFQGADGTIVLQATGAKELDHSVSLIDFRTNASGAREFRVVNHWGVVWSPQCDIPGTVWVSEAFVLASLAMGDTFRFIQAEARVVL